MKINKTILTNKLNKLAVKASKKAPTVLVIGGVCGVAVSTVLACKATLKVNEILEEAKTNIDNVHKALEDENISDEQYSKADSVKDLAITYKNLGVGLAKLYGPAVLIGTASLISIIYSHNLLKKRNASLVAAYTVLDASYKQYRKGVKEVFGEDVDKGLELGIIRKNENFKENEDTQKPYIIDHALLKENVSDEYKIIFDEGNRGWENDHYYNMCHLEAQQSYATTLLQTRGYLFLNEVYDLIGHEKTKQGQLIGWFYDPNDPTKQNYVDFGLEEFKKYYEMATRDEASEHPAGIIMHFNPDGYILDLI